MSLIDSITNNPKYHICVFAGLISIPVDRDFFLEILNNRKQIHDNEHTEKLHYEVDHRNEVIIIYDGSGNSKEIPK